MKSAGLGIVSNRLIGDDGRATGGGVGSASNGRTSGPLAGPWNRSLAERADRQKNAFVIFLILDGAGRPGASLAGVEGGLDRAAEPPSR
jgi:hypothetical protein